MVCVINSVHIDGSIKLTWEYKTNIFHSLKMWTNEDNKIVCTSSHEIYMPVLMSKLKAIIVPKAMRLDVHTFIYTHT